jgi:hypothetical protein
MNEKERLINELNQLHYENRKAIDGLKQVVDEYIYETKFNGVLVNKGML